MRRLTRLRTHALTLLAAAALLTACSVKRLDPATYESLPGVPQQVAEVIKTEIGKGEIRDMSSTRILGEERWQIFYVTRKDEEKYLVVDRIGKVMQDWTGPRPFADIERLPAPARATAEEQIGKGDLFSIVPHTVPGREAWKVTYRTKDDTFPSFIVLDDGKLR
jgi:hypothetical protein